MTKLRELRIGRDFAFEINEALQSSGVEDAPILDPNRWYEIVEEIEVPNIDGYAWVNDTAYGINLGEWSLSDVFGIHKNYVAEFRETEIEDGVDITSSEQNMYVVTRIDNNNGFRATALVSAYDENEAFEKWMLDMDDGYYQFVTNLLDNSLEFYFIDENDNDNVGVFVHEITLDSDVTWMSW